MKLKISKISKMASLSPSGVRFYEKIGVISPMRGENLKIRDFTFRELDAIFAYKCYRNTGFSHNESLELLNNVNPEELGLRIKAQKNKIMQEIEERKALLKHLDKQVNSIQTFQDNTQLINIENNPGLQRIKLWEPGFKESECASPILTTEWFNQVPFVDACFLFSAEDIMHGVGYLESDKGVAIEVEAMDIIGFRPKEMGEKIPSQQCVHTFVELSDGLRLHCDQLQQVRSYITTHKYSVTGPGICRRIYSAQCNTLNKRLDHLWIPIRTEKI